MRDIKFRGKRVDNGEWVYGLPMHGSGGDINYICGWMGDDGGETYQQIEVNSKTVGQYTGLPDKLNNDIYEGDILERIGSYDNFTPIPMNTRKRQLIVVELNVEHDEFGKTSFGFSMHTQSSYSERTNPATYEKIGNIHDNPELLKINHKTK